MPTTVVTGGAGFIGSHVVEALLARGERVVVIDVFNEHLYQSEVKNRNLDNVLGNANLRIEKIDISDVENQHVLRDLFMEEKVGGIIHLAALAGVRDSFSNAPMYVKVNCHGTKHVLVAARDAGVKHVVVASSSSVYGERSGETAFKETDQLGKAKSPYAESKQVMERDAEAFQKENPTMSITALRFFTVYGPRQRPDMAIAKFVHAIDMGEPIHQYGDGSARRDFTYIDDIVQGVVASFDHPHPDGWRLYNLGESSTMTLSEIIRMIEKELGKPAVIRVEPAQEGDVTVTYADISRARTELGYNPKILPEEGIRKYVSWYRATALSRAK